MPQKKKAIKAFRDGKCSIWTTERRAKKTCIGSFNFAIETISSKLFTELGLMGKEIEKTISIPYSKNITLGNVVDIEGESYIIILAQKKDTFPKSIKIQLSKSPMRFKDDKTE